MLNAAHDIHHIALAAGSVQLRAARFDAPAARGLCLLLNGQTEFIEKYFEVIDELRERGFTVVTFDWRGQGGSDRQLPDPTKAHIEDFTAYDQDLATVMRAVVAPLAADLNVQPIALAHSMGGHILLRRLHDVAGEFSGAIFSAPMIGINPRGTPWWVVEKIAAHLNRNGPSTDFVWGMAARDQRYLPFAQQIVTSDPVRYARNQAALAAQPDLRLNGPTWGWLGAAMKSIAAMREPGYAEKIQTECLFFGAGQDRVCETPALSAFVARMPHACFTEIAGAEHEILMERDVFRAEFWSGFDTFLKKIAPAVSR
ncbi:MAG TPA: alpha/beta hydrolase [Rhizomicrobium sp.]